MTIEEKAFEAYPVMETTYGVDVNASFRVAFEKGYNKAIEDTQLTIDDVRNIYKICCEVIMGVDMPDTTGVFDPWVEIMKRIKGE